MYQVMYVFDNEGFTKDRFTIGLQNTEGDGCLVVCDLAPSHPLGMWSVTEDYIPRAEIPPTDAHFGKEIEWEDLPNAVKDAIYDYFDEVDV